MQCYISSTACLLILSCPLFHCIHVWKHLSIFFLPSLQYFIFFFTIKASFFLSLSINVHWSMLHLKHGNFTAYMSENIFLFSFFLLFSTLFFFPLCLFHFLCFIYFCLFSLFFLFVILPFVYPSFPFYLLSFLLSLILLFKYLSIIFDFFFIIMQTFNYMYMYQLHVFFIV